MCNVLVSLVNVALVYHLKFVILFDLFMLLSMIIVTPTSAYHIVREFFRVTHAPAMELCTYTVFICGILSQQ